MPESQVNWYENELVLTLDQATDEAIDSLAFQMEAQTKANIVVNDQVDTGFMLNSVYTVTTQGSSYQQAWRSGRYHSAKTGETREAELAPQAQLADGARALVCVGAAYAVFQELLNSFLYRAAEQAAEDSGRALQRVAHRRNLRA